MDYDAFLERLRATGWEVPTLSFAYRLINGQWQVAFIRSGGKFQQPGCVTFVICVRHTSMRNVEGERQSVEKEPFAYPFKLIMRHVQRQDFKYRSTLLNYETETLERSADWSSVLRGLEDTIPAWLRSLDVATLSKQIVSGGEDGYIERLWVEDLAAA
jgi:hypothetical protein